MRVDNAVANWIHRHSFYTRPYSLLCDGATLRVIQEGDGRERRDAVTALQKSQSKLDARHAESNRAGTRDNHLSPKMAFDHSASETASFNLFHSTVILDIGAPSGQGWVTEMPVHVRSPGAKLMTSMFLSVAL